MIFQLRNRHFLLNDVVLLPVAVYASYLLRFETMDPSSKWWPGMWALALCTVASTVLVFYYNGVYSRYWRYASVDELMLLTGAYTVSTLIASIVAISAGFVIAGSMWIPRSIPFIVLLCGLAVTAGPRLAVRVRSRHVKRNRRFKGQVRPVLIMGAGDTGADLVREIQQNPQLGLDVVGLLDDDERKHNMVIHGVPVLGDRRSIPAMVRQHHVDQVIIAMPTASGKAMREVLQICEEARVQTRTVPGTPELLDGRVSISQVRDVRIDDLLRRAPITTDLARVRELLSNKRVLITGGGGSIGSELARQVQNFGPSLLVLVGHGENSIFGIFNELSARSAAVGPGAATTIMPVVADIRSAEQMDLLMQAVDPEIIFHAAAHKHVPLMEMNPAEAVINNVGGTRNLLRAAQKHAVERFVMVSTDKAVNPTNVMGATKRVAEQLVHDTAMRSGLTYVTVRFGNVLGSRGSVVPTFQKQIAAGGPVTVTHPDVKRYFMTIPEAIQLVLQAAVLGKGGDLFMLDMGEPVRIVDLATDLITLSGLEVGRDVEIEYTGLRPGDKLFEEMFMEAEKYARTEHSQIFIAKNGTLPGSLTLDERIEGLLLTARRNDEAGLFAYLYDLVPEFKHSRTGLTPERDAFVEV